MTLLDIFEDLLGEIMLDGLMNEFSRVTISLSPQHILTAAEILFSSDFNVSFLLTTFLTSDNGSFDLLYHFSFKHNQLGSGILTLALSKLTNLEIPSISKIFPSIEPYEDLLQLEGVKFHS